MPASELKARKKGASQAKPPDGDREGPGAGPSGDPAESRPDKTGDTNATRPRPSVSLGFGSFSTALWLAVSLGLAWLALHQNGRLAALEHSCGREGDVRERLALLSDKFGNFQAMLAQVQEKAMLSQWKKLQVDVAELKGWAVGVAEKHERLQATLTDLSQAVSHIEERTATVAKDAAAQVGAARTDVRRMSGLASDAEALLERVGALEEKLARTELSMAKRIGDLLAGSIDRMAVLRASSERNGQALEHLQRGATQLAEADSELAGRILALESGRARLIKTVTFAGDLKPKVSAVKRDLATLESLLSDLTLRIGQLADDMGRREEDVGQLRDSIANLSSMQRYL